jgi:hypothetical protein
MRVPVLMQKHTAAAWLFFKDDRKLLNSRSQPANASYTATGKLSNFFRGEIA